MHLRTIFSLIILLAMANEIVGGRKDEIAYAKAEEASFGHSSKGSFNQAVDKAVEGTKSLANKFSKGAKKKVVSAVKGLGKTLEQMVAEE
uniref:Uncharacterized protein n=1 Tax=Meloidogyne javanica TaxID=6303 RepID=A0A915LYL9_MELJA